MTPQLCTHLAIRNRRGRGRGRSSRGRGRGCGCFDSILRATRTSRTGKSRPASRGRPKRGGDHNNEQELGKHLSKTMPSNAHICEHVNKRKVDSQKNEFHHTPKEEKPPSVHFNTRIRKIVQHQQ